MPKRFLVRHLGNMGDHVFIVPPVLETLKNEYPDCHITLLTTQGYKTKKWWQLKPHWGERNQGGHNIHLMETNPHVDELITYSDGWQSTEKHDATYELDFGIGYEENPIQKAYDLIGVKSDFTNYKLYFTDKDEQTAEQTTQGWPKPRIVLLEGLAGESTRGWDQAKVPELEKAIQKKYQVKPIWFGSQSIPEVNGRPLTLRQNIATLKHADVAIGVMSGPLHFAAAVGCPTLTLYADQPLHRAAPAYFLNRYIKDPAKQHRTLLGPSPSKVTFLKSPNPPETLTPAELEQQNYDTWQHPGHQPTKSALAPITVEEVMTVLADFF